MSAQLEREADAARMDSAARARFSWAGAIALSIGAALVFWSFHALPFQDLPEHAALIALRHRFGKSPFDQRYYVVAAHLGPYSLFRSLGELLVGPLGPVGAVRAIATLPMLAIPASTFWARRRLHGDHSATGVYYGLALSFGLMTLFGFASYLLGIAVLLVVLTLWLELLVLSDAGQVGAARRREAVVALLAPLVLIVHGHAFLLFIMLATLSAFATGHRVHRALRLRSLLPALAFSAWVSWRERSSVVPAGSAPVHRATFAPHFQGLLDKLSLLVTPTLLTRTGVDVAVGLLIWGVVIWAAWVTAQSLRTALPTRDGVAPPPTAIESQDPHEQASRAHSGALLVSVLGLVLVFAILPHEVGWFGFVDGRLVLPILLLAVVAIRVPALGPRAAALFVGAPRAAAFAMVTIAFAASYAFQAEADGWREVLSDVPARSRLLSLPVDPNSAVITAHPFVHYDKLVMAERPTVVSDLWFHQGSAVFPTAENPALALPASYHASDLRTVDWPSYHLNEWDYVLVRTRPMATQPQVPAALRLTAHQGGWWLYRTERPQD